MDNRLQPQETELVGGLILVNGRIVGDLVADRIEALVSTVFQEVAVGNWEVLYRDPNDGRYWELTYPQGHMHGGGPPALKVVSHDQAMQKSNVSSHF
jgi:hypothetical protein